MKQISICIFCSIILLSSCSKENLVRESVQNQDVYQIPSHLVSATLVSSTKAEDVIDNTLKAIDANPLLAQYKPSFTVLFNDPFFDTSWRLDQYYITYTSQDNEGNDITLSGDIAFINETSGQVKRELNSVFVFHTLFNTDDYSDNKLFNSTLNLEYIIMPVRALYNNLVVFPHYQGAGADHGTHPITPSESLLKARQAIDLELAAIEFINSNESIKSNVKLSDNYYTQNVGISNGASTALAFQYLVENNPDYSVSKNIVKLDGTYCGEGCYDLAACISDIVDSYQEMECSSMYDIFPYIYTAMVAGSFDTWEDTIYKNSDITALNYYFSSDFYDVKIPYKGEEFSVLDFYYSGNLSMSAFDIFEDANIDMSNIVNNNLKDPQTGNLDIENTAVKALFEAFNKNKVIADGWSPASKLRFVHSKADEFLPYEYAYQVYENLSNNGFNYNVSFKSLNYLGHIESSLGLLVHDCCFLKNLCPER